MKEKSISLNWILTVCNKIFVIFVPLITTPYIARTLGSESLGVYTYCLSYSSLFIVLGEIGIPIYGKRNIAIYHNDKEKQEEIFSELLLLQRVLLFVSLILYLMTAVIVGKYWWMFLACGMGHLAAFFDVSWLFEGIEDFKNVVVRNFLIKIVSVILIFVFIRKESDLYLYAFCLFSANLIGNFLLWINARKRFKSKKITINGILKHIVPSLILLLPYAVTQLFEIIDKSMLGSLSSNISEVAYYEQSRKIISICMALITSLGVVLMPRMSSLFNENKVDRIKKYTSDAIDLTLLLSVSLAFGCAAISDSVVPWFFGPGFEKVSLIMKISAPLLILMGINDLIGTQILTAAKREKKLLMINVIGVFINMTFNFWLIPNYSSEGAMIATVIAESVKCIMVFNMSKDFINLKTVIRSFVGYMLIGIIMCIIVRRVFLMSMAEGMHNTFILIFTGIVIYVLFLFVTKNYWIALVIGKFKEKLKK